MAGGSNDPQHPFQLPDGSFTDWAGYQRYLDGLAANTSVTFKDASGRQTTMTVAQYRQYVAGQVAANVKAIAGQMTLDLTAISSLSDIMGTESGAVYDVVNRLSAAMSAVNLATAMGAGQGSRGPAVPAQPVADITGNEPVVQVVDLSGVANSIQAAWGSLRANIDTLAANLNSVANGLTLTGNEVWKAEVASLSGFGGTAVDPRKAAPASRPIRGPF